jgi:hypothetical protein
MPFKEFNEYALHPYIQFQNITFEISKKLKNTIITFIDEEVRHVLEIPDGIYTIKELNNFLQDKQEQLNMYLIDETNKKIYYWSLDFYENYIRLEYALKSFHYDYMTGKYKYDKYVYIELNDTLCYTLGFKNEVLPDFYSSPNGRKIALC